MRLLATIPEILALSAAVSAQGYPQSSQYTDSNTGISFNGYADGTGYQFGMVMAQDASTDFIVQLISPLTQGEGWAGVDFGEYMTGHLLLVAWPNGDQVMISPRFATGYEQSDTLPYTGAVTLSPIKEGTFVNKTHVSATFVCHRCMNSNSFNNTMKSGTFAYAYSSVAVTTPSDPSTPLSDHTTANEPYGAFGVRLSDAKSAQYAKWAAMANAKDNGNKNGTAASSPTPTNSAVPSPKSSSTGAAPASTGDENESSSSSRDPGPYIVLVVMGMLYGLQAFSFL